MARESGLRSYRRDIAPGEKTDRSGDALAGKRAWRRKLTGRVFGGGPKDRQPRLRGPTRSAQGEALPASRFLLGLGLIGLGIILLAGPKGNTGCASFLAES